jgi:hypothetical protein
MKPQSLMGIGKKWGVVFLGVVEVVMSNLTVDRMKRIENNNFPFYFMHIF